jgi:hypothetical protein
MEIDDRISAFWCDRTDMKRILVDGAAYRNGPPAHRGSVSFFHLPKESKER